MTKRNRRIPMALALAVVALAGRGCQGTNTGSPHCPIRGWCQWPVEMSLGERTFRGSFHLQVSIDGAQIAGQAFETKEADGVCTELQEYVDVLLQWENGESSSLPNRELYVHFDDSGSPLNPFLRRPSLSVGDTSALIAEKLELVLGQDGQLAATLAALDQSFYENRASSADSGLPTVAVHIQGPITVQCPEGQTQSIPVGTGTPAQVRCAVVPAPQPPCNDVVEESAACSLK